MKMHDALTNKPELADELLTWLDGYTRRNTADYGLPLQSTVDKAALRTLILTWVMKLEDSTT